MRARNCVNADAPPPGRISARMIPGEVPRTEVEMQHVRGVSGGRKLEQQSVGRGCATPSMMIAVLEAAEP